jgi:hypothetical protein
VPASTAGDAPDEDKHLLLKSLKGQHAVITILGAQLQDLLRETSAFNGLRQG